MQWNLEQLEIFVGVAEGASFSAMGRRLGRAQSAISSAIALLETDLGVELFERSNGRTPVITAAGQALLEEAREVLRQCQRLDSRAQALCAGQEPLLRLALDEAMPYQPVLDALDALATAFPHLEVQLTSSAQGDVARKLLTNQADLGLLFRHEHMPQALERQALGDVAQVTACSASHPLAGQRGVGRRELARHRQLLIAPLENAYPGGEQIAPQVWRADSFYLLAELLMRGLGWGWLPRHVARYPSYQGLLAELDCDWVPPALVVELAWRRSAAPGPAARWLAQRLAEELRAIG